MDQTLKEIEKTEWRSVVGGLWEEIGALQFNFLVSNGLLPSDKLLDVGCGCLRGGVHFIRYLNNCNYFGMDKNQELLSKGLEKELPLAKLENCCIHLQCRDDFQFTIFETKFDFAIAQSVFTHLPWNSILRCLAEIKKVLLPTGRFFATFFEDDEGLHVTFPLQHLPGGIITYSDRNPFHYKFSTFEEMAKRLHLNVSLIGEWNHPRNQKMMVFSHE